MSSRTGWFTSPTSTPGSISPHGPATKGSSDGHRAQSQALEQGVHAFPATPFTADLTLDEATLERHVAEVARHRPIALVPAGGAGELFSIDIDEHAAVVRATVASAGGLPVIAGVGGGFAAACAQARNAERAGADGVLVLPPYLVTSEQEGLVAYVRGIAAVTALPLIVYSRDNGVFRVDTLLRLAEALPTLLGVKDGTSDLDLVLETRRRTLGRLVVINGAPTAEMLAAQTFAIGVTAYSSAVFAFAPAIARAFYDAVAAGDRAGQDALLAQFYFPYSVLRRKRAGNAVAIVKAGLKVTGRPVGPVRPPLLDLTDADCEALRVLIETGARVAVDS
jgi:5-dehydro-4-deoxyglucarate dehydratase